MLGVFVTDVMLEVVQEAVAGLEGGWGGKGTEMGRGEGPRGLGVDMDGRVAGRTLECVVICAEHLLSDGPEAVPVAAFKTLLVQLMGKTETLHSKL